MQIADNKRNKYQKRQRYIKFNVKMSSNFCVDLYCYDIIYTPLHVCRFSAGIFESFIIPALGDKPYKNIQKQLKT